MAKAKTQETILTVSGYEVDKDLVRVPIKVSHSLQALIANQLELMEIVEKNHPDHNIFIEQHRMELLQIEQEISYAYTNYMQKKEKAREKREQKKATLAVEPPKFEEDSPFRESLSSMESHPASPEDLPWEDSPGQSQSYQEISYQDPGYTDERPVPSLDEMADRMSPGLPSAKYEPRTTPVETKPDIDVRRVAIGAAIKSLRSFLGRELTEEEIVQIENQVDSYLK